MPDGTLKERRSSRKKPIELPKRLMMTSSHSSAQARKDEERTQAPLVAVPIEVAGEVTEATVAMVAGEATEATEETVAIEDTEATEVTVVIEEVEAGEVAVVEAVAAGEVAEMAAAIENLPINKMNHKKMVEKATVEEVTVATEVTEETVAMVAGEDTEATVVMVAGEATEATEETVAIEETEVTVVTEEIEAELTAKDTKVMTIVVTEDSEEAVVDEVEEEEEEGDVSMTSMITLLSNTLLRMTRNKIQLHNRSKINDLNPLIYLLFGNTEAVSVKTIIGYFFID